MFLRSVIVAIIAVVGVSAGSGHSQHDIETMGPLNPLLGTHGWPDCVQDGPISDDIEVNQMTMRCVQRGSAAALKVR